MWSIDKKNGVAYYKFKESPRNCDYCSDQEAGQNFIIDSNNDLFGFSFLFPEDWFGPDINKLKITLEKYFDSVSITNNSMNVHNNSSDKKLQSIQSDIIIDFNDSEIVGLEFLFRPIV
jgi:hypothetical protein